MKYFLKFLILNFIQKFNLQTNTTTVWNDSANPYDFEINNLLYIDPASKYIYANSSSKGSINDCLPENCENPTTSPKPNLIDEILSHSDKNINTTDEADNTDVKKEPWEELCHFGQHQSPINIKESPDFKPQEFRISYNLDISKIEWRPFYKKHNFGVDNISNCSQPHLTINSPLYNLHNKSYCLNNIHIHLSCDKDTLGSEHALQYEKFNAELHFVYIEYSNATNESTQLAIYEAIFLRISNSLNHLTPLDKLLKTLINYSSNATEENHENLKMNELIELNQIFDPIRTPLYIYRGSLTSAPCTENILWMILKYPAVISYDTFDQMRQSRIKSLESYAQQETTSKRKKSKIPLTCDNFRPLQNQIKQQVYKTNTNLENERKFKLLNLL